MKGLPQLRSKCVVPVTVSMPFTVGPVAFRVAAKVKEMVPGMAVRSNSMGLSPVADPMALPSASATLKVFVTAALLGGAPENVAFACPFVKGPPVLDEMSGLVQVSVTLGPAKVWPPPAKVHSTLTGAGAPFVALAGGADVVVVVEDVDEELELGVVLGGCVVVVVDGASDVPGWPGLVAPGSDEDPVPGLLELQPARTRAPSNAMRTIRMGGRQAWPPMSVVSGLAEIRFAARDG